MLRDPIGRPARPPGTGRNGIDGAGVHLRGICAAGLGPKCQGQPIDAFTNSMLVPVFEALLVVVALV